MYRVLVQGGKKTGVALVNADNVSGVLFTGSEQTGHALHLALAGCPEKIGCGLGKFF